MGASDGGSLTLWAEDGLAPAEGVHRPGRRPKVREHPFALDVEELAKVLGDPPGVTDRADLALPGFSAAPSGSPELLDLRSMTQQNVSVGESARLHPGVRWRVPVLHVPPGHAMPVLAGLASPAGLSGEPDDDALTVRAGGGLRLLQAVAGFAVDLVSRGRVLPVVLPEVRPGVVVPRPGGRALARWRPLLTGADAEWFRAVLGAFPGSGAAAFADPARDLPESLATALDALVDAAVRERLPPPSRARGSQTGASGWRRALRADDPAFDVTGEQLAQLTRAVSAWQADALGGGALRACFRLTEPADDDEESVLRRPDEPLRPAAEAALWRLDLGMQVADQPSLFVPAERIWGAGAGLDALVRHSPHPEEVLLAELGRALRLFPLLGRALAGPRPVELLLDTGEAHDFLAGATPLLIAAGFGVQLPGWWTRPQARLGARLRATTPAQPGRVEGTPAFGQSGIVEFDWRLSIGSEPLTDREIDALADAQRPLVKVRGEWMQIDPDRLRRARDFLRRRNGAGGGAGSGGMSVADVLHVLGSAGDGPGGLPVTGVDAEGWLGDLLAPAAEQKLRPVELPPGFTGTLRPYQERGVAWLAFLESIGMGAVLADDMGLGKTVQLLALIAG